MEKTISDIFLNYYKSADKGVKESSYQSMKYLLTHLVAKSTLKTIHARNSGRSSRSVTFMDAIVYWIDDNVQFMKLNTNRILDRTVAVVESDSQSNFNENRKSTSRQLRSLSDSGNYFFGEENTAERSRHRTESKKSRPGCRCRSNSLEDIDRKRWKTNVSNHNRRTTIAVKDLTHFQKMWPVA